MACRRIANTEYYSIGLRKPVDLYIWLVIASVQTWDSNWSWTLVNSFQTFCHNQICVSGHHRKLIYCSITNLNTYYFLWGWHTLTRVGRVNEIQNFPKLSINLIEYSETWVKVRLF